MKVRPQEVARHLARLDAQVACVLLYGPDGGLAEERAQHITRQIVGARADPFLVARFTADGFKGDPARLHDEMAQPPLTGEKRLIRVDEAGDALADPIGEILQGPPPANFLLLLAGGLGASSKLRRLIEGAGNALAIACYGDEAATLDALIDEVLGGAGWRADGEARRYLIANLGGDRALSRRELEKLLHYLGPSRNGCDGGTVDLAAVQAVIADSAGLSLEQIAEAALSGEAAASDRTLARALEAGQSPVAIIRVVLNRIERLHRASVMRDAGRSASEAIAALRPPVFWKDKRGYEAQLQRWSTPLLARALDLALEAEIDCKTSGIPSEAAVGRAIMRLAQAASRA